MMKADIDATDISKIRAAIKHARATIAFHDLGEAIEPIFEEWVNMKSREGQSKGMQKQYLDGPREKISVSLLSKHSSAMRRHAKDKGVSIGSIVREAAALWFAQNEQKEQNNEQL